MKKQNLILHKASSGIFHTVIKNRHGRLIYLELENKSDKYTVRKCIYIDRTKCGEYYAVPKKLTVKEFAKPKLLHIVATLLDRQYYGIEYSNEPSEMSGDEFIKKSLSNFRKGYKFLILVGEGEQINELPSTLTTRLANRIHRRIYLKIKYYKDGLGVIEECHYYDRTYKTKTKVIPQMLSSVFIEYNRKTIIDTVNRELNCDFTDIIIADNGIDVENNSPALCGNI